VTAIPVKPIDPAYRLPGDIVVTWTRLVTGSGWTRDRSQPLVSWKVCTMAGEPVPNPCWVFQLDWSHLEPADINRDGEATLEIRWP
jgi:hypothetical protein